jgi:hypothetical protein
MCARDYSVKLNSVMINPFQSSCYKKFPQPGREEILNPRRATKRTVLLEKLVQQGHEVKIFLKLFLYIFSHPVYFLCSFDDPIAFFGGIISHMHHPKYLQKVNSKHYITKNFICVIHSLDE